MHFFYSAFSSLIYSVVVKTELTKTREQKKKKKTNSPSPVFDQV